MAKVLLGLTGSVASIRAGELVQELTKSNHRVRIVTTSSVKYFLGIDELERLAIQTEGLFQDKDEWPGDRYQRGQGIPHIALRDWCDLMLIAPIDAHTLAKMANGLADNLLTSVFRAWDFHKAIVIAPAMNTLMWYHPVTVLHLNDLAGFFGVFQNPGVSSFLGRNSPVDDQVDSINNATEQFHIVSPIKKILACGEEGMGALADPGIIVAAVNSIKVKTFRPGTTPE